MAIASEKKPKIIINGQYYYVKYKATELMDMFSEKEMYDILMPGNKERGFVAFKSRVQLSISGYNTDDVVDKVSWEDIWSSKRIKYINEILDIETYKFVIEKYLRIALNELLADQYISEQPAGVFFQPLYQKQYVNEGNEKKLAEALLNIFDGFDNKIGTAEEVREVVGKDKYTYYTIKQRLDYLTEEAKGLASRLRHKKKVAKVTKLCYNFSYD